MSIHQSDSVLFDYQIYRFGRSRQVFRGPKPELRGKYVAFLGASHTFGRFSNAPFPNLIEQATGVTCLNLGTDGAGPGFFVADPEILRTASQSRVCVIQVMSARNMSNRMYSVRPRRNNRIHAVADLLKGIYPEVDFERFTFASRMLDHLREVDPVRFRLVENEMKNAWMARMRSLLTLVETKKILFWFSERRPEEETPDLAEPGNVKYPYFVDRAMIDAVRPGADAYVELVSSEGLPMDLTKDGAAVLFRSSGQPIEFNLKFPSPEMHRQAADALRPEIERLMKA